MAAYEAYSAVFFNHFIINGLQKSLFCMPKQVLLQSKTGSFENQQPHIGVFNVSILWTIGNDETVQHRY